MFTDEFSAALLGPIDVKMEEKLTKFEYWRERVMVSGRKVAAEEVENPSCMGLDPSRCIQPGMAKANAQ